MRRPAGFTLVEMLVAAAVSAFVLAGAGVAFQVGTRTLRGGADQADAQQNARWALERLVQEIRGAGLDPRATPPAYNFDAVTSPTATGFVLQSDHDGDGVLDPPGACDVTATTERVSYRLVDTRLRRSTDPPNYTCEGSIIHGVNNLQFTYLDADGVATATPSAIRTIVITLTIESLSGGYGRRVSLTDRVRLRNR
jgi:prepilin-type N-terminal cleavage/methylation domain-containing protein